MPRESARAYAAASDYFKMRANRSLVAVAKMQGKDVSLIERWSKRWGWVNRANAYDEYLAREEQKAIIKQSAAHNAEWRRRADEQPEQEYQIGKKLENKVNKMLEFPLTTITMQDGKTTVRPARWDLRDVVAMMNTASKLIGGAIQKTMGVQGDVVDEEFIFEDAE